MESTSTPPGGFEPAGDESAGPSRDLHLTTFTHEGRFWDVHLEFVEEADDPHTVRARLRFAPADRAEHEEPERTAVIFIEPSRREVVRAARALGRHHLAGMLRSVT